MADVEQHEIVIPDEAAGKRLDKALAELFPEYSRSRIRAWIDTGQVSVDGSRLKPKTRLVGGERIVLSATLEPDLRAEPQDIPLNIVFEDSHILVINKPAGLVVHPGAGNPNGTVQNALLHHVPDAACLPRAGLVHRIDKDTSGLLVVAKTPETHTKLVRQLEAREIHREYRAVCVGVMTGGGTVDAPIGRHPVDRVRMSVRKDGRPAVTHYRVLDRFRRHSYLAIQLETGRTHQIRVHLAHVRYPLVGDPVYGRRLVVPKSAAAETRQVLESFKRQALHAAGLSLGHPVSGEEMKFTAPLADDMNTLVVTLRNDAEKSV